MQELAKTHLEKLPQLKKYVEDWYDYWSDNNDRYREFMNFVFNTSLTDNDIATLKLLQKPAIEFNVLEAYISRLRGEFAAQEPSLTVRVEDGVAPADLTEGLVNTAKVVEAHIRDMLSSAANDGFESTTYSATLAGGFSVAEVGTDYLNEMSFEQKIYIESVFDPTLCGFDPLAKESHKGDGKYCFKVVPKTKEEFIAEYGADAAEDIKFSRASNLDQFNWSYQNQKQEIVLVCSLYVKEAKKEKLVKLSNGKVILKKHHEELKAEINEEGLMIQPPIVIDERPTTIETIVRYDFCETKVLAHFTTDFKYLPLVFFDGNSVLIQEDKGGTTCQMTRPYVYHAKGIQRLKNFAGQTVGNEMETMVQHKWIAPVEGIPETYKDAYTNPQAAQVLVYNAFYDDDPEKLIPPPREVQRTPTPPIVHAMFMGSDQVTQAILGSYDAQLGISNGDISGKAIQQGAMHSNAAAMPYSVNYYKGLNRLATIFLDLIPKYYVTPRSIPIRKANGLRDYQIINKKGDKQSVSLKYDPNSLQIKVEAGVSTALQKQMALDQIIRMMGASELFSEFINTNGLETLLDNIDIRGIDDLKLKAMQFMDQKQKQMAEQAQQPDPMQQAIQAETEIEMSRIEQKREQAEGDLAIKSAQVSIDKQKADTELLKAVAEIEGGNQKELIEQERINAEMSREAIEVALAVAKHHSETAQNFMQNDLAGAGQE